MPQLNPNPWFFTMLMTWLIFTLIIQPKLMSLTQTNTLSNKTTMNIKITPWNWPWT